MADSDSFGKRLRAARVAAGFSQTRLAELVGASRQAVTTWEKDLRTPYPNNIARIAAALGIEASSLFPPPSASLTEAERLDRLEQAFRELRVELVESGAIAPSPSDLADRLELVADEGGRRSDEPPESSDAAQGGR